MDSMKKERLEAAGIDVDNALARFMGSEALLMRFLSRFPDDVNEEKLKEAVASGDREGAFAAAHALKGVSGNLSMTVLFDLLTRQVAAFRAGDWPDAVAMMPDITTACDTASRAIRENCQAAMKGDGK